MGISPFSRENCSVATEQFVKQQELHFCHVEISNLEKARLWYWCSLNWAHSGLFRMGLVSLSLPQASEIVDGAVLQIPVARLNSALKCLGQGVTHPVSVHLCQTVASQVWCKFTHVHLSLLRLSRCMNRGVETHTGTVHSQPAPCGFPLARYAVSVSLAAFHLFRCQWTGSSHSCTLLDTAGWQPLGLLLLCDQWVKSCNCLQQGEIWDTSPALGCKHIHLSAVVTCMIKRGKMERDKMSLEDQLDEMGKKDQKGAWLMDLHPGQEIHTLRSALTYSCPLPILRHVEVGLDWLVPRAHWHCPSRDKEIYTDSCSLAISLSLTLSRGIWTGMGSRLW